MEGFAIIAGDRCVMLSASREHNVWLGRLNVPKPRGRGAGWWLLDLLGGFTFIVNDMRPG